jgi:hypothetical protein
MDNNEHIETKQRFTTYILTRAYIMNTISITNLFAMESTNSKNIYFREAYALSFCPQTKETFIIDNCGQRALIAKDSLGFWSHEGTRFVNEQTADLVYAADTIADANMSDLIDLREALALTGQDTLIKDRQQLEVQYFAMLLSL